MRPASWRSKSCVDFCVSVVGRCELTAMLTLLRRRGEPIGRVM